MRKFLKRLFYSSVFWIIIAIVGIVWCSFWSGYSVAKQDSYWWFAPIVNSVSIAAFCLVLRNGIQIYSYRKVNKVLDEITDRYEQVMKSQNKASKKKSEG